MLVSTAATNLRLDPVVSFFVQHFGLMRIFLGLNAYLMRDRVLDEPETARPFYLGLLGLHATLWCFAYQAEQAGFARHDGTTVPAGVVAVLFGSGAVVALRFGPTPKPFVDTDDDAPWGGASAAGIIRGAASPQSKKDR